MKKEVTLRFLGGARKVGCSAILVECEEGRILLDYGATPSKKIEWPLPCDVVHLDAVILTHAHIDHSGAIPLLFNFSEVPVIMTPATLDLTELLIYDMFNVAREPMPFSKREVKLMRNNAILLNPNTWYNINDRIRVKLLDAGHIPGSASILLDIDGVRIWYTGDINTRETQLLRPADTEIGHVDVIITESTYALRDHPPRKREERKLIEATKEVLERGGVVLIPAFSVGRSQEVLCIFRKYGFDGRVVLDGMARHASRILLQHPEAVKDYNLLVEALKSVKWIQDANERYKVISSPSVIVSPAGMLVGGSADWYLKYIYNDPTSALFYVSYQVKGTPGREILETKKIRIGGKEKEVKAEIRYFELSSHSGRTELLSMLTKVCNGATVFTVHGDEESTIGLANELREIYGIEAYCPAPGDKFRVCPQW